MENLTIKCNNALISKTACYVNVNGEDINNLIKKNLPTYIKDYKEYPASIEIKISISNETVLVRRDYEIDTEVVE